MAQMTPVFSQLRLTSDAMERAVCTVNGIAPDVSADTAFNFAKAIEQLYNDGSCSVRLSSVVAIVE